ncbi:unnamed protein product [Closterium sp. NIES-65]|nr:unnamed protein product [Closterium sp. NIES-65]
MQHCGFSFPLSPPSPPPYSPDIRTTFRAGGGEGAQGQLRQAPQLSFPLGTLFVPRFVQVVVEVPKGSFIFVPCFVQVVVEVPKGSFVKPLLSLSTHGNFLIPSLCTFSAHRFPSPPSPQIFVPRFVQVVVEVPKGSFVKRHPDGAIDYVGCVPCPFNYGSVPSILALDGTTCAIDYVGCVPCPFNYDSVPSILGLDGEPHDAVVLGWDPPCHAATGACGKCISWHPYLPPFPLPISCPSASPLPTPRAGDPLGAVVLGPALPYGHTGTWQVHARLRFIVSWGEAH